MVWKPGKVKRLRYCLRSLCGSILELAQNDCTGLFRFAKTELKEAGISQVWFSQMPWTEDCAYADKKHAQKHTTTPFLDFPDRAFYNDCSHVTKKPCRATKYFSRAAKSVDLHGVLTCWATSFQYLWQVTTYFSTISIWRYVTNDVWHFLSPSLLNQYKAQTFCRVGCLTRRNEKVLRSQVSSLRDSVVEFSFSCKWF